MKILSFLFRLCAGFQLGIGIPLAADLLHSATARADAGTPGSGSANPVAQADGIRFALPVATDNADRFFWDIRVPLDLSDARSLRMEVTCAQPESMRAMTASP